MSEMSWLQHKYMVTIGKTMKNHLLKSGRQIAGTGGMIVWLYKPYREALTSQTQQSLEVTSLLFLKYNGTVAQFQILIIVTNFVNVLCIGTVVPLIRGFTFHGLEAGDPPFGLSPESHWQPNALSQCLYYPLHFLSSPRHLILSRHHSKMESTVQ